MADTIRVRVNDSETEVGDGTVIGRSRSAGLPVSESVVSRTHARLHREPDGWFVTDLGSANGIYGPGGMTAALALPPGVTTFWLGPPEAGCRLEAIVADDLAEAMTVRADPGGTTAAPAPDQPRLAPLTRAGDPSPTPPTPAPLAPPQPPAPALSGVSVRGEGLVVKVDRDLVILDDVSLALPGGSMTAIIGPSGCGKSTLAGVLAGRREPSAGTVTIDGELMTPAMRQSIGVVPQYDAVHERLTVRHALRAAARLRLPSGTPAKTVEEAVRRTATTLGLDHRLDTRIGKLSGGQKKRVSVGYELVSNPSMMVLDEPTSGLDPGLEQGLVAELRALADRGTTTIVITHSPDAAEQADLVVVMAPGGHLAFVGTPPGVLEFFGTSNWGGVFNKLTEANAEKWADYFAGTTAYHRHLAPQPTPSTWSRPDRLDRSWMSDFAVMLSRYARSVISDPKSLLLLAAQAPILGFLFAAVLSQNVFGPSLRPSTAAREFVLAAVLAMVWIGASNSIREIVKERITFLRERAVGVSASSLVASRWVVLSVITILQAIVLYYAAASRQATPLTDGVLISNGPLELILALAAVGLASVGIGLVLSGTVKDSNKAMAVLPIVLIPIILFSGLLIPTSGQPGLEQISYVNPVQWGSSAAAVTSNVLDKEGCNPTGLEAQIQQALLGRTISCSNSRWQTTPSAQAANFGLGAVALAALVALSFWVTSRSTGDGNP